MKKGIVLFDIKDFLYQGMARQDVSVEEINKRQAHALEVVNASMSAERQRRLSSQIRVPTVHMFLPTGDGYYLLCAPELNDLLDIAHCCMGMLEANNISAYFVAHIGEVSVFTDMSGRENATGFDLGLASRLQEVSRSAGVLTCSQSLVTNWRYNRHFELDGVWRSGPAKDGVEYRWMLAAPKDFLATTTRFQTPATREG